MSTTLAGTGKGVNANYQDHLTQRALCSGAWEERSVTEIPFCDAALYGGGITVSMISAAAVILGLALIGFGSGSGRATRGKPE